MASIRRALASADAESVRRRRLLGEVRYRRREKVGDQPM